MELSVEAYFAFGSDMIWEEATPGNKKYYISGEETKMQLKFPSQPHFCLGTIPSQYQTTKTKQNVVQYVELSAIKYTILGSHRHALKSVRLNLNPDTCICRSVPKDIKSQTDFFKYAHYMQCTRSKVFHLKLRVCLIYSCLMHRILVYPIDKMLPHLSPSQAATEGRKEGSKDRAGNSALLHFLSCMSKDHLISPFFLQYPMRSTQTYSHKQ